MLGTTMVLASSLPSPSSSADVTPTRSLSKSAVVDRAVIVGGGLGGLSAALQLRRAGIDAQVYEKRPMISGGEGTLISIFPNGCRALNEANPEIVEKMRRAGTLNMPSKIVYPDGTKIGEWNLSTQMEEKFGQPLIAILWKDALRILSETLPDSCQHTGYDCIGITEEEDGAVAHFKKENEEISIKAPLIIGADGIRSVVRTSLFGNIPPRDNGRMMWRAVIDMNKLSDNPVKGLETGIYSSLFNGRTVFIVNGLRDNLLYWAFSVEDEACEGSTKIRSKTLEEARERVLEYFQGFSLAQSIIKVTDPELILERRVLDLPVLSTWSKGKTVLLGDAVHAVTPALGQGANLAFEDGIHLANCLISCDSVRSALEQYEEIRMPRCKEVSKQSQSRSPERGEEFYNWLYCSKIPTISS